MKRFLSLLLAVVLVLGWVPSLEVLAAEAVTVYLDPGAGSDDNAGTEAAPVKSFEGAYALLQAAGGTIVMLSDATYSASYTLPACDHPVTITSKTGAEGIKSNSHLIVAGETTFENISLTLMKKSTGTTICGGGHKLTMGEGVTTVPFVEGSSKYYFCLAGGFYSGTAASTDLTVKSGYYRYLYAGGYTGSVTGNAKLTMTGGTAANLAVSRTGDVGGDVEMHFSGTAQVSGSLYGVTAGGGDLKGSCTITLGKGVSVKHLYAGGNGSGGITGVTTIIYDGFDGTLSTLKGTGGADFAGTMGGSRLVLKSGTLNKAPTAFDTVDIDIPQDKTLTLACALSADTLASAGTLCFSGAASLTAAAVNGSVSCEISGGVMKNQVYITAPAGSDITFPEETGVAEYDGKWESRDLSQFKGLVLKTDPANKVVLYTGLWRSSDDTEHVEVTPYLTETVDGFAYYYYPNAEGTYYVRGTRSGYIGVYQNIYMSPEEAATKTVETVTLEEKASGGYVPSNVYINTSEVMSNPEAWKSEMSMFPEEYTKYMQNPTFDEDRPAHLMTTGEELEAELTAMDQPDDDMYRYSMGKSLEGRDIPLVIFTETDLSQATTMQEAAAALEDSDKLTILYRAHMHGNEPAGGEGALAMLYKLQDGYAEELLDEINLIVVPRLNPDGAYNYLRRLSDADDTDPNRDQLHLKSVEMQQFQSTYLLFDPEVVIDGHERMWNNPNGDMQISTSFTTANSDEYRQIALELDQAAFQALDAAGLEGFYYTGVTNTLETTLGGGYYPIAGSMYILQESRGIHESDEAMERRVVGQMASATGLLNYLHENAQRVKAAVEADRETVARNGETYEETDLFALDTDNRTYTAEEIETLGILKTTGQTINWATGEVTYPKRTPTVDDKVVRSRPAPTAYVIPADLKSIEDILYRMELHGIPYTYLPQGATLSLQRYGGTTELATLSEETVVRFAEGCYVFTMNHSKGLLLASILEPDNINTHHENSTGNFATIGYLGVSDTYRYIHDLNDEGFVDYTITEAEPVNITVWLDGTNGLDTNDGLTEAAAVKTLEQAYAIMDAAMEGASAASQANLKIIGLYDLGTARVTMPAVSFHVTISGKTAADGFSFTGGSSQETRIVDISGDTTFQHMTIHSDSNGNYNHLNACGHKLVLGEGLNCTTRVANRYFIVAGGTYNGTVASTDLTVRSGKWRTIYAGGYIGAVTGEAKADISGCWVYQNITPAYRGNVGSADIKIANTTVNDGVDGSAIYAGPATLSSTSNGRVKGDVTITLGENIEAAGVYASARTVGIVVGKVTIIVDGVDLSKVNVYAKGSDTTGTVGAAVLKLNRDVTQAVTLDAALPVDLNGHNITGGVTVDGVLQVKDSQTDDFTVADGVYGEITGTVTGALKAAEGYVAVDGKSFHRFEQKISGVAIRPSIAGIYYLATWQCDEVLAAGVESFGLAVSAANMPGADFDTDSDTLYTRFTAEDFVSGKAQTSAMIANILKAGEENDSRGKTPIFAVSYVTFEDGTVLVSEGVEYSLYDVMKQADQIAYEANKTALEAFYATWEDPMKDWEFTNIGK